MRTVEPAALDTSFDLDALRAVLEEHPVRLAILFGSHATETTHARSDVDLAVELNGRRPSDPGYNDAFLGLSADLSETLETDDVDLVDLHAASPTLAAAIFENGVLIVGEQAHATERRRQLTAAEDERHSPRQRLEAAIERIDAHLGDGNEEIPATGDKEENG